MNEWMNAVLFGLALIAFVMGMSSVIMALTVSKKSEKVMQERVEFGFFGAAGFVLCALMSYALI